MPVTQLGRPAARPVREMSSPAAVSESAALSARRSSLRTSRQPDDSRSYLRKCASLIRSRLAVRKGRASSENAAWRWACSVFGDEGDERDQGEGERKGPRRVVGRRQQLKVAQRGHAARECVRTAERAFGRHWASDAHILIHVEA